MARPGQIGAIKTEITGSIHERRKRFEAEDIGGNVHFKPTRAFTTINVRLDDGREGYGKYTDPDNVRVFIRQMDKRKIRSGKTRGAISPSWYD